ncbi:transcription factor grauzone-like [Uranotaenia lowii]|uniref:transcription factor grauzone-like n=1 Tax=Uranotaenia lowii TaxID=190385 RepID=UPI0024794F41|nr:transcription factor grauzone-like [Uranotaenia lowii]
MTPQCLTCFQAVENVNGVLGAGTVQQIIRKYLWFTETELVSALICPKCWESVYAFHRFYESVEQLYQAIRPDSKDADKNELPVKLESMAEVNMIETTKDEELVKSEIKEELESDSENGGEPKSVQDDFLNEEQDSESESETSDYEDELVSNSKTKLGRDADDFIRKHIVLSCGLCDQSDVSFQDYLNHMEIVHGQKQKHVICCGTKYNRRELLYEHVRHVFNSDAFQCPKCQYKCVNSEALKRHLKLKHNIRSTRRYNNSNRIKKAPPEKRSEEALKKKEEADKRREERQKEDVMMREHIPFGCIPCGQSFEAYRDLYSHERIQHKRKPVIVCCGHRYNCRQRLLQHVQSINNPIAFRCELCFRCFGNEYLKNEHKKKMHTSEAEVKFRCDRCPKTFTRELMLQKHLKDHEDADADRIKCDECGKRYTSHHVLYMHIRNKHRAPRFVCDICAKAFHLKSEFNKHKMQHENPDQLKMQCQHCLKWFKNRDYWRAHVRLHVVGEIKCELCDRVCPNRVAYRSHWKHVHGNKSFKCDWCDKTFKKALNLKEHIASRHTGDSLYTCSFCPKTFNSNANMHSHQKKMHPIEWQAMRDSIAASKKPATEDGVNPGLNVAMDAFNDT